MSNNLFLIINISSVYAYVCLLFLYYMNSDLYFCTFRLPFSIIYIAQEFFVSFFQLLYLRSSLAYRIFMLFACSLAVNWQWQLNKKDFISIFSGIHFLTVLGKIHKILSQAAQSLFYDITVREKWNGITTMTPNRDGVVRFLFIFFVFVKLSVPFINIPFQTLRFSSALPWKLVNFISYYNKPLI